MTVMMLSSPRTHAWMLCVMVIPPAASLHLLEVSHYSFDNSSLLLHLFILGLWIFALNNVVYEHYFGPFSSVPMAGGDWFGLAHAPYIFDDVQGMAYLRLLEGTKLDSRGIFRVKGFFHWGEQIVLTNPATFNEFLNTHSYDYVKPPKPMEFLSRATGYGLIAAEMGEHKAQRKAVWPAFQGQVIRELVPGMWRKSVDFANVIAAEMDQDTGMIEFGDIVSRATLDIIGVSAFGKDFETLYNSDNKLASTYKIAFDPTPEVVMYFAVSMILPSWLGRWVPMSGNRKLAKYSKLIREQCQKLINDKKAELDEMNDHRPDILSVLLRSRDLADEGIQDQMLTFLAAGHETTSSASALAVYLLATHPDIQQRLRNEVRETLSKFELKDLSLQVLDSMPYLAAVATEALRLWPTVPVTARIAVKETTIAGLAIPPGATVQIAPITIHRLPSIWGEDVLEFKPDRWLGTGEETKGGSNQSLAYTPFLHGPRACIGQVFARSEMRCLIAAFVERFRFEMFDPNEKLSIAGTITVKPRALRLRVFDLKSSLTRTS